MKKCPTCQRTFEDSLRFCQADGTPLVADEPVDPYKTMVARPEDIASAVPSAAEPQAKEDEEVLELPVDERKTMYVSEEEIRKEMAAADEQVIEIPPLTDEPTPPEPPKFSEPSLSPPSFGDVTPPPSPFSAGEPKPIEHHAADTVAIWTTETGIVRCSVTGNSGIQGARADKRGAGLQSVQCSGTGERTACTGRMDTAAGS